VSIATSVVIDGRELVLTGLERPMYPESGFTKGDVVDFVVRVAPVLLPHLSDRVLTLGCCPDGVDAGCFEQSECPSPRPAWVRTVGVVSAHRQSIDRFVVDDLPGLVWAMNLGALELHPSLARADAPDVPTSMVFDLEPGPPAGIDACARAALLVRELLRREGLTAFVKTSGARGLQIHVPLNDADATFRDVRTFARATAVALEKRHPELVVAHPGLDAREGKVFADTSPNDRHGTMVSAYSLRAVERPAVSTPVTWDEVEAAARHWRPGALVFEWSDVVARVERFGDLFAPVLTMRQRLPAAV
jgi:bifunctional non-homologous end joining protein LigD